MAKPFSIRDLMDEGARQQDCGADVYEKVSVHDVGLNPKNEYTISEIEKLKDSIYALGGVQQNVVLVKCPEWSGHKYLALDGHRRLMACRQLVAEGYTEFEYVPAVIKAGLDADTEDAMLVMINSTQRNKSDWEKVMEHMKLKEIIPRVKKRQGLDGRIRDIEADMLGVSHGQISIYNTIGTRLIDDLMRLFKGGNVGITLAHEAAQLGPGEQRELVRLVAEKGSFDEGDVKRLINRRTLKGQIMILPEAGGNVPESGTSGREPGGTASIPPGDVGYVPESGTSEKVLREAVGTQTEENTNVPESGTSEKILQEAADTLTEENINVPESGTLEPDNNKKVQETHHTSNPDDTGTYGKKGTAALRGGYGMEMVEQQIRKYGG